ncbi:MAG: hypothetical protein HUN04_08475 [Desulfobacter sp.]|nr:MAG: hypothetical protein HUN04_08475 [Desulfobacter sp.]
MLFFGLFLTIAAPAYGLILIAGLILSLLIFRGAAIESVKSQLVHSYWYFSFYRHVFIGFSPRTWADYTRSWQEHGWPKLKSLKIRNFLNWCLDEAYAPHLLVACGTPFLFAFFAPPKAIDPLFYRFLMAWAMAGCFCFFVTKTRLFLFLGEGERYLEFALFPSIVLSVLALAHSQLSLWSLVFLTVALGLICLFRVPQILAAHEQGGQAHKAAVEKLNDLPDGPVFVFGYSAYQALYWGKKELIGFPIDAFKAVMPKQDYLIFAGNYPLPDADFDMVMSKYHPRYIYGQEWAFGEYAKLAQKPDAFWYGLKKLYGQHGVVIYEVLQS